MGWARYRSVQPFPHAKRRLRLDDPVRTSVLARRVAPAVAVPWTRASGSCSTETGSPLHNGGRRLTADGSVMTYGAARMMTPTVRRLGRRPVGREPALQRFLERHGVPIQGEGLTTFVFVGEADRVDLEHWIYGLPGTQPFDRVAGTTLWHLSIDLPARVADRVQARGSPATGTASTILDPLNPRLAHDPFGANSVCSTEGYQTPEWAGPGSRFAGPARSSTSRSRALRSGAAGPIRVYLPARYRAGRRYPLLVVHDGSDYLRYSSLQTCARQPDHPARGGAADRRLDRPGKPAQGVRRRSPPRPSHHRGGAPSAAPTATRCVDEPGGRGLMGASLGAVASLSHRLDAPGDLGPAHAPVGIVRLHRHRADTARPRVRAGGHLDEPVPGRPGRTCRPGIRELWRIRVAHLREPVAGADAAAGGDARSSSPRRATGTTGRTGATGCAKGCPSSFPDRSG